MDCNCYCFLCNESLIAVNREIKQRAHFRHFKESKCSINFETYLHWLSKELFKEINHIFLPPIRMSDLSSNQYASFLTEFANCLKDVANFNEFANQVMIPSNLILQQKSEIKIDSYEIERTQNTVGGYFRPDILVYTNNTPLLIEPFLTSRINDVKLSKVGLSEISTISINLINFVKEHEWFFSTEDLKKFLIEDIINKKWVYIRNKKSEQLNRFFFYK